MRRRLTFRAVLFNIHLYGGLVVGLVLVMLGITGTLLVFRHELEAITEPHLFTVAPAASHVSPDSMLATIRTAYPNSKVKFIRVPRSPSESVQLLIASPDLDVFADPYRGTILGARKPDTGWLDVLFDLHVHLAAANPEAGEFVVGICGIVLVVLSLTGLYLWWPGRRRLRAALTIRRDAGRRRFHFDLHRVSGAIASVLLILVALTGIAMVFHEKTEAFINAVTASPKLPRPPKATANGGGVLVPMSRALAIADSVLPGGLTTYVSFPRAPKAPLTLRRRMSGEVHPNGRSFVYFEPSTGAILRIVDARQNPIGTRIANLMYPIHIGQAGGVVGRILLVLTGITLPVLMISGVVVWWIRTRRRVVSVQRRRSIDTQRLAS